MVKVIDIDLDRRRISLSLKQANEGMTPETEFDPALYGMAAEYDDAGNYIYPEGFDPDTGEWREGYESQREEWERQYQAAYARYEQHIAQLQRTQEQEAEAAEAAPANYSSGGPASDGETSDEDPGQGPPSQSGGGALASDAQLAALREKLSGG
jgi:small subunit ribosomal protein S1